MKKLVSQAQMNSRLRSEMTDSFSILPIFPQNVSTVRNEKTAFSLAALKLGYAYNWVICEMLDKQSKRYPEEGSGERATEVNALKKWGCSERILAVKFWKGRRRVVLCWLKLIVCLFEVLFLLLFMSLSY